MKHTKVYLSLVVMALAGSFVSAQELSGTTAEAVTGTTTEATTGVLTQTGTTGTIATTGETKPADVKNGFFKIRGTWKLINEDFGAVKRFFKRPLTGDMLSGSKALIKEKNTAIKALNQEIKAAVASSGVVDWSGYVQKLVDIYTNFKTNALPYVASGKVEVFNKYIDGKIALVKKSFELRQKEIVRKEMAHKKSQELKEAKEKKITEAKEFAAKKIAELKEKREEHKRK